MNDILDLVNKMNDIPQEDENFHVIKIFNKEPQEYEVLTEWCEKNCIHPWKSIINEYKGHGWQRGMVLDTSLNPFTFLFKHDNDATLFRMTWVDEGTEELI